MSCGRRQTPPPPPAPRRVQIRTDPRYTLSASGLPLALRQTVVAIRFSQIQGPDAPTPYEKSGLAASQRDYVSGEPLQALDALRDRPAAEVEDQLVHADRREGSDVGGDLFRRAGKGPARSVRRWNAGVVERCLVGDRQRREIASLGLGQPLQRVEMLAHLWRRQRRGGDGADRMPAVAMPGGAPQGGPRMAPDPDRRMRLLHREGLAADIGVAVEAAIEAGGRLRPQLLEDRNPLIGHRTPRSEGGAVQRFELL